MTRRRLLGWSRFVVLVGLLGAFVGLAAAGGRLFWDRIETQAQQAARIELVETLPLTVTGKVQKGRLRSVERRRALGLLE